MHDEVMYFINKFKCLDKAAIEDVFLHGNCYWFAQILMLRFPKNSSLHYMEIEGHFIVQIDGRFYDISGERKDLKEIPTEWKYFQEIEPNHTKRIYKNCALFID